MPNAQHIFRAVAPRRDGDGQGPGIQIRRVHIGHHRIPTFNHHRPSPLAVRPAVPTEARYRGRIIDRGHGDIHGIGRTGEGRRPPIARRAHLAPCRPTALIPGPHRQHRRTRPVVVGIRCKIQPRARIVCQQQRRGVTHRPHRRPGRAPVSGVVPGPVRLITSRNRDALGRPAIYIRDAAGERTDQTPHGPTRHPRVLHHREG